MSSPLKLVKQQNAIPQQALGMAGTAPATGTMPQRPPKSPLEESDSALSFDYGSDTEAIIHHDWCKDKNRLQARTSNLKA